MHTDKKMNVSYQASLVNRHIRRFTGRINYNKLCDKRGSANGIIFLMIPTPRMVGKNWFVLQRSE